MAYDRQLFQKFLDQPAVSSSHPMDVAALAVDRTCRNIAENTRQYAERDAEEAAQGAKDAEIQEKVENSIAEYEDDGLQEKAYDSEHPPWNPQEAKRQAPFRRANFKIVRESKSVFEKARHEMILDYPIMAELMNNLRDDCEGLVTAELAKQRKDDDTLPRLITAISLEPRVAKDENDIQAKCEAQLAKAKTIGKTLVCSLAVDSHHLPADALWAMLPDCHPHRKKGAPHQTVQRIQAIKTYAATCRRISENGVYQHFSDDEKSLLLALGFEEWKGEARVEEMKEIRERMDDDDVAAAQAKMERVLKQSHRYKVGFNKWIAGSSLTEEQTRELKKMALLLEGASEKLELVKDTRGRLILAAYAQHYFEVEDLIEDVGLNSLAFLAAADPGEDQPWAEGRRAAQAVLGACQRMGLKNLKLRTRVPRRPKAEGESAPIPPPWYR